MRTRMSGGVGGGEPRSFPLSRFKHGYYDVPAERRQARGAALHQSGRPQTKDPVPAVSREATVPRLALLPSNKRGEAPLHRTPTSHARTFEKVPVGWLTLPASNALAGAYTFTRIDVPFGGGAQYTQAWGINAR